jgi:hypothetical protein
MSEPSARYVGDRPNVGLPALPPGFGALLVSYWFTSTVEIVHADRVMDDGANFDVWTPWPDVRLDGQPVPASWAHWWYPLRSGPHEISVNGPAAARFRTDLAAGQVLRLKYRADVRIRKHISDTIVVDHTGTATFRPQ